MDKEEMKLNMILGLLRKAESKKQENFNNEDYGYYAGKVSALEDVLDILQGE